MDWKKKEEVSRQVSLQFCKTAMLYELNKYILNSAGFLITKVMLVPGRK